MFQCNRGYPRRYAILSSLVLLAYCWLLASSGLYSTIVVANDATSTVERLGNPFTTGTYARNVWDMQVYNNRIYLGHGNSSNSGPDTNAGPITIWHYDVGGGAFVNQAVVPQEQVDIYRIIDGVLYTPGHDPRGGNGFGDFYRLEGGAWQQYATIPNVIHTYDITGYQGQLFVANGTYGMNMVMASTDQGKTWRSVLQDSGRAYSLFTFQGTLYAQKWVIRNNKPAENGIMRFDGTNLVNANIPGAAMIPGSPYFYARLVRVTEFNNKLIYIASEYGVNDHQWTPFALYVAPQLAQAQRVSFAMANALPYDIIVRGNTLYVLASAKQAAGAYTNIVYVTTDLVQWTELFRFDATTFARSFEELDGDFYFGLGCNTDVLPAATGDILRVRRAVVTQPTSTSTATTIPTNTPVTGTTPTHTAIAVPTNTPVMGPTPSRAATTPTPSSTPESSKGTYRWLPLVLNQ